jgi:hypothetical protein
MPDADSNIKKQIKEILETTIQEEQQNKSEINTGRRMDE